MDLKKSHVTRVFRATLLIHNFITWSTLKRCYCIYFKKMKQIRKHEGVPFACKRVFFFT